MNVEVNISGGSVRSGFDANSGSVVNISGGSFDGTFHAFNGSTINLFGTTFVLDSVDIKASLTLNEPFTIDDRNVTVSGLLADGSAFAFGPNSAVFNQDFFDPGATLTVTLVGTTVPEPASVVLALLGALTIAIHGRRHGTGIGKRRI